MYHIDKDHGPFRVNAPVLKKVADVDVIYSSKNMIAIQWEESSAGDMVV